MASLVQDHFFLQKISVEPLVNTSDWLGDIPFSAYVEQFEEIFECFQCYIKAE